MITSLQLKKAEKVKYSAQGIVSNEMPNAKFIFIGMDEESIYFNVVARKSDISDIQIDMLKVKTPFMVISEYKEPIYKAEFKMNYTV